MDYKNHFKIKNKHNWKLLIAFIIGASLLGGCGQIPTKNNYLSESIEQRLLKLDLSEVGTIYVPMYGLPAYPNYYWLNDIPLATQDEGYIRVPLYPGEYTLKSKYSFHSTKEVSFNIDKGEKVYFTLDGSFVFSPYKESTKEEFDQLFRDQGGWKKRKMIGASRQFHEYLPQPQLGWVKNCLNNLVFDNCEKVYNDIPLAIIDSGSRQKIIDLIEGEKLRREVAQAQQAFEATLPKEVLRDKYMLALSESLSNRQFNKAIPIFKKLQNLNMPLDPDFYYFYGEALFETGKNTEALQAITSYIRNNGPQASYYQESLVLLNRIQSTL